MTEEYEHFEAGCVVVDLFDKVRAALRSAWEKVREWADQVLDLVIGRLADGDSCPGRFYKGRWVPLRDPFTLNLLSWAILSGRPVPNRDRVIRDLEFIGTYIRSILAPPPGVQAC